MTAYERYPGVQDAYDGRNRLGTYRHQVLYSGEQRVGMFHRLIQEQYSLMCDFRRRISCILVQSVRIQISGFLFLVVDND